MPTRAPLTIGVFGTGGTSRKNATSGVSDAIGGGKAKLLLPVTETHYTDAVKAIAEFARRNEYPYEVIVDDSTDELDDVDEVLDDAQKTHKVAKPSRKLVSLLEAAGDKGKLLVAWDDEDTETTSVAELALSKGVASFDLTNGNEPLELEKSEPDDEPAEEDEEREEQPETDATTEPEPAQDEAEDDADEAQASYEMENLAKLGFGAAGFVEAFLDEIRRIVREEVTEATKPRPRGRPRKDGQPAGSAR
jgi:cobalamin biosynthesis protein CobT